jgi:rhamnulose-1-phosphate aldolase
MMQNSCSGIDDLLKMMGEAGKRLAEIGACEGAAGNITLCLRRTVDLRDRFPLEEEVELPQAVPDLVGATFIVSGSGRRLRQISDDPPANVACIVVNEGGRTGRLLTSQRRGFQKVTSEFNSHLAVHNDRVFAENLDFHALVHAQPLHLTYLSHIDRYRDERFLNSRLMRWQPETIINFPEGIGALPFFIPGSPELVAGNLRALASHSIVIWAKHGVMSRSGASLQQAIDLLEYAETAATYEYLNLAAGEPAQGMSREELQAVCAAFHIKQNFL